MSASLRSEGGRRCSELLDAVLLGQAPRTCRASAGVMFGVHVLRRGVRTSQNRLSDNTVPFFSDALLALGGL